MGGNKAIFLDRDGTINKEKHYLYKISEFEYLDGVVAGLKEISDMGYLLVVITNQSGIARGYYTEKDYRHLDEWMKSDLLDKGVKVAASYYCPHLPEGTVAEYAKKCSCRKPKTELYWRAADELDIDMDRSFAVGDKLRDLSICAESGVKGILLSDSEEIGSEHEVCRNWAEIVQKIKADEGQDGKDRRNFRTK